MCLIVLAWRVRPDFPLIVAANRDEFHARPAARAAFWQDHPAILAGRDLEANGTWMGVTRSGRFAAVTNYRGGRDDFRLRQDAEQGLHRRRGLDGAGESPLRLIDFGRVEKEIAEAVDARLQAPRAAIAVGQPP